MKRLALTALVALMACTPRMIAGPGIVDLDGPRMTQECVRPARVPPRGATDERWMIHSARQEYARAIYAQGPDCTPVTAQELGEDLHARISIYMKQRGLVVAPRAAVDMLKEHPTYCRPTPEEYHGALLPVEARTVIYGKGPFQRAERTGEREYLVRRYNPRMSLKPQARGEPVQRVDPCPEPGQRPEQAPIGDTTRSAMYQTLLERLDSLQERIEDLSDQDVPGQDAPPDGTLSIRLGERLYLFPGAELVCMRAQRSYCVQLEDLIQR